MNILIEILISHVRTIGRFRGLGPTIVVCPATLMDQWVKHFHEWWPFVRVVVLHQSSCYKGKYERVKINILIAINLSLYKKNGT